MTQKKDEALNKCQDEGQVTLLKAMWALSAKFTRMNRRMEERNAVVQSQIADLANRLQDMKADISVSNLKIKVIGPTYKEPNYRPCKSSWEQAR